MTALVLIDHRMRHHAQCLLFVFRLKMNGRLHIILGTPDSSALLSKFLPKNEQTDPFASFLPRMVRHVDADSNWAWMIKISNFEFKELSGSSEVDFFLFFSNHLRPGQSIRSHLLKVLADEKDLIHGANYSLLNSTLLRRNNPN